MAERIDQYLGTGRRKCSVARVYLRPGKGKFIVNNLELKKYFGERINIENYMRSPMKETQTLTKYDVIVNVFGGGIIGQAGAIRHGIARALVKANAENRPSGIIVDSNSICRDSLQGLSDDLPCLIADEHGLSRPTAALAAETTAASTRHTYLGLFAQTPSTVNGGQPDAPTFDAVQQWVEELTANRARRCADAQIPALLD